ncbi:MAG: hypothetical protein IJN92_08650 [Lachnospiraceae bacterium]|nr:hypothetical protein [Lachnospiraceae bacterium]
MTLSAILSEKTGAPLNTDEVLSPDCILLSACFMGYISADTFFPSALQTGTYASFITKVNRLIKRGYLKSLSLPKKDGNIRCVYSLTEAGYLHATQLFGDCIPPYKERRKSKNLVTSAMHEYSSSLNFLPFLSLPFLKSIKAEREINFLSGKRINGKNHSAVCVDVLLTLNTSAKKTLQVYIEEDLGTETIRTLVKKLTAYEEQGIFNTNGQFLLFSFRKPYTQAQKGMFKPSSIEKLLPYVGENLKNTSLKDIPKPLQVVLSEIREYFPDTTDKKTLLSFAKELRANNCPLKTKHLNRFHLSLFYARRNSMREFLLSLPQECRLIRAIHNGAVIGCGATPRIADSFHFLFYEETRFLEKKPDFSGYARYFPGLDEKSYEKTRSFSSGKEDTLPLVLRNIYSCLKPDGSRQYVAFEDISHDLGAILRCAYMISSFSKDSDPVSVIMNADSPGEAIAFALRFRFLFELDHPFRDRAFLYFTIRADGKLYCVTKEYETGREILRVLQAN